MQTTKQLLFLMTTCFIIGISLTSCEKELYEDAIQESPKGTINYVKIEDVPFLIPSIEKFNKDYSFLSDPLKAKNTNKDGENLNLNLEQIIEYVQANGLKSYSIAIKKEFGINDDLYFENLTIYEKEGEYKSLILKYNQNDDTEKFDLETFSGTLELFDINYNDISYIQYESGLKAHIKYFTFGCLEYEFNMTTGVSTFWFNHCGDTIGSTQTDTNSSPGGGNSNSTGTSGPSGGTPSGGTTGPQGGTPGGGANNNNNGVIIIAPNPLEVYKDKRERNFIQALQNANQAGCFGEQSPPFKVSTYQYLETTLIDDDGLTAQTETYPQEDVADVQTVLTDVCDSSTPGDTPSIIPFLIEKNIDDTLLDPCTKGILDKLKQNHTIANIIARFDNPDKPYSINFNQAVIPPNPLNPNQVIYGQTSTTTTKFVYNVTLNSTYFNNTGSTNLGKAKTIIHEMLHALIVSIVQNATSSPANNNDPIDFPVIWEAYISGIFNGESNATQHAFIGNNYVTIMAQALQEYNTGIPLEQNEIPEEMYKDLSWSGLFNLLAPTSPFDSILTGADKARIYNRNRTEMDRTNSFGMTPSSNNPCLQ